MKERLEKLFDFLKTNRAYNKNLQKRFYGSIILPYDNVFDKVIFLLYHIANTQRQPKIDYLSEFYKKIFENKDHTESFYSFLELILPGSPKNFNSLFIGMKNQPGWGNKTSALFSKTIFHLHNKKYPKKLRIWNDAPYIIDKYDDFYLPVDTVIISIFKQLDSKTIWDFNSINKRIKKYYRANDIEIWDDLWFWGFITQNGSESKRSFGWNENKYWTLKESNKDPKSIIEIKLKAEEFLSLLMNDLKGMRSTIVSDSKSQS